MNNMNDSNKPISAYSVTELKAIGYDTMQQIKTLEYNLSVIQNELTRRTQSVVGSVSKEHMDKIQSEGTVVNK
jgi:ABC-type uncharacterized transport system involved in gliding motility auxiliary subunit